MAGCAGHFFLCWSSACTFSTGTVEISGDGGGDFFSHSAFSDVRDNVVFTCTRLVVSFQRTGHQPCAAVHTVPGCTVSGWWHPTQREEKLSPGIWPGSKLTMVMPFQWGLTADSSLLSSPPGACQSLSFCETETVAGVGYPGNWPALQWPGGPSDAVFVVQQLLRPVSTSPAWCGQMWCLAFFSQAAGMIGLPGRLPLP